MPSRGQEKGARRALRSHENLGAGHGGQGSLPRLPKKPQACSRTPRTTHRVGIWSPREVTVGHWTCQACSRATFLSTYL